jgi:hypothetical protein
LLSQKSKEGGKDQPGKTSGWKQAARDGGVRR